MNKLSSWAALGVAFFAISQAATAVTAKEMSAFEQKAVTIVPQQLEKDTFSWSRSLGDKFPQMLASRSQSAEVFANVTAKETPEVIHQVPRKLWHWGPLAQIFKRPDVPQEEVEQKVVSAAKRTTNPVADFLNPKTSPVNRIWKYDKQVEKGRNAQNVRLVEKAICVTSEGRKDMGHSFPKNQYSGAALRRLARDCKDGIFGVFPAMHVFPRRK